MSIKIQASTREVDGPLLELEDVRTYFETPRGVVRAVDGVSLKLERGRALGIVGESGSGKTILSRSIMGLLPPRGTIRSGSVRFEGREIGGLSRAAMRDVWGKEMAMIFQDPMTSLNPLMKIGAQIAEPLRIHLDMPKKDSWATAERLMQDVRIPAPGRRLQQYPHEMSGGMRQRIMIAIAMAAARHWPMNDDRARRDCAGADLDLLGEQRRERTCRCCWSQARRCAGHTDDISDVRRQAVEMAPTIALRQRRCHTGSAAEHPGWRLSHPAQRHSRAADLVNPPVGCRFAAPGARSLPRRSHR